MNQAPGSLSSAKYSSLVDRLLGSLDASHETPTNRRACEYHDEREWPDALGPLLLMSAQRTPLTTKELACIKVPVLIIQVHTPPALPSMSC